MYNYAVKHHAKKANVEMKNNAKLTPLTLASKLGCKEIFQEIIEQQSVVSVISGCLSKVEVRYQSLTRVKTPLPFDVLHNLRRTNVVISTCAGQPGQVIF